MAETATIETFTRPNGKPYRPREHKLVAHAWTNHDDNEHGVIVLGTLDPERAEAFAREMCAYWYGVPNAVRPVPDWYRQGFQHGEPWWIRDAVRGRPGVQFTAAEADGTIA